MRAHRPGHRAYDEIVGTGLIAVVRSRAGIDTLLEIADALLASPLTVLAVAPGSREPWAALAELHTRFGPNMTVGCGFLRTPAQVMNALDSGAAFVLVSRPDETIGRLCRSRGALYVPIVATAADIVQANRNGASLALTFVDGRKGLPHLARLRHADPEIGIIVAGGVDEHNVGAYAQAGATAAAVRGVLSARPDWQMARLIRHVRALRRAWESGLDTPSIGAG